MLVAIAVIFSVFSLCWLFFDRGLHYFLLPIAPPVTLSLMVNGEPRLVWAALFLYAVLIGIAWQIVSRKSRKIWMFLSILMAAIHIICFVYTNNALEQMGSAIGHQIIGTPGN